MNAQNTQMIIVMACALMRKHGLDSSWSFTIDHNATARGGQTRHRSKQIGLSLAYIKVATKDEIKNTVLHEIAHAIVGPGHGHDDVWKAVFIGIGGDGSRCMSERVSQALRETTANYRVVCLDNGHFLGYRKRRSNIVNTKVCGICSSRISFEELAKVS